MSKGRKKVFPKRYGTKPHQIHAEYALRKEGNWPKPKPPQAWMIELFAEREFQKRTLGSFNRTKNKKCPVCFVLMPITGQCDTCS